MFKKNKNPIKAAIECIILFSLLAVAWFYINREVIFDHSIDFYELEASDKGIQKDKYVSLQVNGVLGNYAETKHYTNLIPTGTDQHYILWLENDEIISLHISNKKQINLLNEICDHTWNYLNTINEENQDVSLTKKITVKGIIHTIDPEIQDYYTQTLNQIGISDENTLIYYVELDATCNRVRALLYLSIALTFVALSVFSLIRRLRKEQLPYIAG